MITVYHVHMSRSERVLWLLEELGLPYHLERHRRSSDFEPIALQHIHPLGKSPIMRDGDTVLIESGAILEYIIHRHGGGRLAVPPSSPDYARYLQWLHFGEGSAMSQFVLHLLLGFIPGVDPANPMVGMLKERTFTNLRYIDGELAKTAWFAGVEFSAADIMMAYTFGMAAKLLQIDFTAFPHIAAYRQRIEARPAYQKAMAIANAPE